MNSIIKTFLIVGLILTISVSCKEDLELTNPNELSEETYFKRPER